MKGSQVNCRLGVEDVRRLHEAAGPYGGIAKWILAKLDGDLTMKVSTAPAVVPLESGPVKLSHVPTPKPFIKESGVARCQRLGLRPGDTCLRCKSLNMNCTCDG